MSIEEPSQIDYNMLESNLDWSGYEDHEKIKIAFKNGYMLAIHRMKENAEKENTVIQNYNLKMPCDLFNEIKNFENDEKNASPERIIHIMKMAYIHLKDAIPDK